MLFFQCRNLSDLRITVKFSPVTEKPSPRRILQGLSPLGGVLTHFPQRSPSGLLPLPGTPNRVLPLCPPGVRQTRAEWDRVRGCRRGVPPKCMSTLHAIHTHHMPPVRTIGTTPLGREWCVWVGVDRFVAMDGGQRRWRCSAIVAHTRGNAGLWGRTLSAFPEGEEGPIHPEIHRIIPQHPTRGRRA